MSRDVIYRTYQRGARGCRYRTDHIFWDDAGGANPLPEDPTVIEMPDGIVELLEPPEWGYANNYPVGVPEIGTWGMRVHYWRCSGSEELENFRTYMQEFRKINGAAIYIGGVPHYYDLYNVVRIYSDRGSDGATWTLIYEGEQRQDPEPTIDLQLGRGSVVDYDLHHLAITVPAAVKMEWICKNSIDYEGTDPWHTLYSYAYDNIWKVGSAYYIFFQFVATDLIADYLVRFTRQRTTWIWAQRLMSTVYKVATRSYEDFFPTTYHVTIDSPYDLFQFYEIDPETNGELGDPLDTDDINIMGEIYTTAGGGTISIDDLVAGANAPGKDSLYQYGDLLTFMQAAADACIARCTIDISTPNRLSFRWHPATDVAAYLSTLDITRADMLVTSGNRSLSGKLSAHNVGEIETTMQDVRAEDQGSWKKLLDATASKRISVKQIFDVNPLRLKHEDWVKASPTLIGPTNHGFATRSFMPFKFYCFMSIGGGTFPARVHHVIGYPKGSLDMVQYGSVRANVTDADDLDGQRAIVAGIQGEDGMQAAIMGEYSKFNDVDQTLIDVAFRYPEFSAMDLNRLGNPLRITPADADGHYTVNTLLASGDTYQRGHASGILVRGKIDKEKGTLNGKFFGREE